MKNNTVLANLANYFRIVEEIDKATNTTTAKRRAKRLSMSDFGDKAVAKLYRSRILVLANAVNAFHAKESDDKGAEFKKVLEGLQGVFDFMKVNVGTDCYKSRNSEARYILECSIRHKFVKVAEGEELSLERMREGVSLDNIRGLAEEVLYYRINGLALPTFSTSASVATANARQAEEAKKKVDSAKAEKATATAKKATAKKSAKAEKVATAEKEVA